MIKSFSALRGVTALSLCLAFGQVSAQDYDEQQPDPPDRAARLSYLQGDVSLQPAGEDEWADAVVNRPLTTGDKLWTDQGSRAEIYVGQAAVRLNSYTGFSFLNVDDDTIQMRITAGVIDVNVRALDGNDQIEIDTPNLALSVLRPGNYRVEVNDAGDTTVVKVSEGAAEASGGSQNVIVHAQQVVTFRGVDQLVAQFGTLGAPDDFDSWTLERERRDDRAASSQSAQYVGSDVTGYEDLDDNGSWSSEAEYGYVWTPRAVAVGWSPYQDGRWVWVAPWGWTWIDDAPWAYAPSHYGRWAHVRSRWCWVPGPRHTRAVYAPALVGWVGASGNNVAISAGGGGVAWFPLGPREVYVPGRRYSHRYVERVNVSNTVIVNRTHITNVYDNRGSYNYRNRNVPGAVTAVTRSTFTSAQRIRGRQIRVDEREFSRTTAVAPRIEPVRESRLGARDSRRNVRTPPQTVVNRQVVVKRDPPPSSARFARSRDVDTSRDQVNQPQRPQDRARPSGGINASTQPVAPTTAQPVQRGHVRGENPRQYSEYQRADRPQREQPQRAMPQPEDTARQPREPQPVAVDRQREVQERQQQVYRQREVERQRAPVERQTKPPEVKPQPQQQQQPQQPRRERDNNRQRPREEAATP